MTLALTSVILVTFSNQSTSIDSQTNNEALAKAQEQLENMRALSRQDFNLVNSKTTVNDGTYNKNISVMDIDFFTKKVTSSVSWTTINRSSSIQLSTLITNPQAANGGSTCSSVLSGDWKNPIQKFYEFGKDLLVPSDPSSGFPITDISAASGKLYVTVNNTDGNNFPNFFIFDISNSNIKPVFLTSVDNDTSVKAGLNAITVAGKYAYVANANGSNFSTCTTCGQLQIIDISATPPQVKKTFKIPGVIGKNGQSIGQSIFYKNAYVYLGLAKTLSGPEFNVINVQDPLNPIYKGGYSVGNGVNKIFVKNNYAYIATPNSENMTIIDVVIDPANPTRVGGYSPSGGSNGESITVVGSTAYLGRTFGTNEFYILNVQNPGSISVLGSKDIGTGSNTSINGLIIRDYLAFLITKVKFEIWNISNPASITQWATPLNLPGGSGTAIGCSGNYIYVGSLPSNNKGYISIISPGP